jgi:hypothetical protein
MNTRYRQLLILNVILAVLVFSYRAFGQEATPPPEALPTQGTQFEKMIFQVALDPTITFRNPFDAAEIQLLGVFTAPSGGQVVVPGFWMQPFEERCAQPCEAEELRPSGDPVWQVRFTAQEVGAWRYALQLRTGTDTRTLTEGAFDVAPGQHPGFIRRAANDSYFQYSSGQPYVPIGLNLKWAWEGNGGVQIYLTWLRDLAAAGGSYARLFIDVPWFIALEALAPVGDYRAAQQAAARLDMILDAAHEYGIALQMVLLWHQSLSIYNGPPVVLPNTVARPDMNADWDNNPYNLIYGGPVGGPAFFFSNEQAAALFRQRLNYIVARWGYSPDIFAWELIDEIDRTAEYDPQVAAGWLQQMSAYLKQIDVHGHLVTAGSELFEPTVAASPLLDFSTAQFYQRLPIEGVGEQITETVNRVRQSRTANLLPTLLTAFSLNPWYEPLEEDPAGIHVQETLWAAFLSGAAGGAMSDWWDTYILPQGIQRVYTPFAAFVSGVDWPALDLRPAEAALVTDYTLYRPARFDGFNRVFTAPPVDVLPRSITADGVYPSLDDVPSYLYGQVYNSQLSQAQIYRVTLPVDSYLEIGIARVSTQAGARLVVQADNQYVLDLTLPTGSRDTAIRVPLAAGAHELTLDNLGDDWLEINYFELGQLQAPARTLTLRDSATGVAFAWIQHRDYAWEQIAAGVVPQAIASSYVLDRMPAGRYRVEIWQPLTGAILGEAAVSVGADMLLRVELPLLENQLALRVFRVGAPPDESILPTVTPQRSTVPDSTQPPLVVTNTPRPSNED